MSKIKPLLVIILTIGIITVAILAIVKMRARECDKIQVTIQFEGEYPTVTESDVINMIKKSGVQLIGKELKEIDLGEVSAVIAQNPFILQTNKIYFQNKSAVIDITLKKILLHVYPQKGEQYFIDENGHFLPYSPEVRDNLIIANGNIKTQYKPDSRIDDKSIISSIFRIAQLIEENEFYAAQFRQLYVNDQNEIEIIPTVGKHVILFGDEKNAAEKLFNLKETYKNGLTYVGMDQYALLDVRYKNRVIAKKR
jgi:cell division protein FtsQ